MSLTCLIKLVKFLYLIFAVFILLQLYWWYFQSVCVCACVCVCMCVCVCVCVCVMNCWTMTTLTSGWWLMRDDDDDWQEVPLTTHWIWLVTNERWWWLTGGIITRPFSHWWVCVRRRTLRVLHWSMNMLHVDHCTRSFIIRSVNIHHIVIWLQFSLQYFCGLVSTHSCIVFTPKQLDIVTFHGRPGSHISLVFEPVCHYKIPLEPPQWGVK